MECPSLPLSTRPRSQGERDVWEWDKAKAWGLSSPPGLILVAAHCPPSVQPIPGLTIPSLTPNSPGHKFDVRNLSTDPPHPQGIRQKNFCIWKTVPHEFRRGRRNGDLRRGRTWNSRRASWARRRWWEPCVDDHQCPNVVHKFPTNQDGFRRIDVNASTHASTTSSGRAKYSAEVFGSVAAARPKREDILRCADTGLVTRWSVAVMTRTVWKGRAGGVSRDMMRCN